MISILFLAGCQSMVYGNASDLDRLKLGMTKTEVVEVMGAPIATNVDGDKKEEQLVYKRMKHTISSWPRTYQVTLRDGRVIKWGEQYQEQNVNAY